MTLEKRPSAFLKFFFKIPVWIHKMGFGGWERLIGAQWMLLTTTGRRSGKPREAMVDVMDYDAASDTYYIEAAYGSRADWYRNMQVNPVFEARVGRRKFKARAVPLSNEGAGEMIVRFYRKKPAYTRSVMAMVGMKFEGEDELRVLGSKLTLLAVTPAK
ncbi:MAG: nitroreductase family deazaflavin-dependent oxidoreductase [Anaerolineaceae bacterium]|nr:MAG: nitroreductase family deazaflavin-dependent oxidoreductase [Anaerolineaceae bacterium]